MPSHSAWYIAPCVNLSAPWHSQRYAHAAWFPLHNTASVNSASGGVKQAPEAIPSMNRPIRDKTERRQDYLEIRSIEWTSGEGRDNPDAALYQNLQCFLFATAADVRHKMMRVSKPREMHEPAAL